MKYKTILLFPVLLVLALAVSAFQVDIEEGWRGIFHVIILALIALAGAPLTQLIKNGLSALLKKPIEDRWAILLTGVCAALLAALEMALVGALHIQDFSSDALPDTFWRILAIASIYYGWFKGSESIFGKKLLLKPIAGTG